GEPSERPHIAVVPLAFIDSPYADGNPKGFALVLPRELSGDDRLQVLGAFAKLQEIGIPNLGSWRVEAAGDEDSFLHSLNERPYVQASCRWATVTPMAF